MKPTIKVSHTWMQQIKDDRPATLHLSWEDGSDHGVILSHDGGNQWNSDIIDHLKKLGIRFDAGYEPGDGATIIFGDREEIIETLKSDFDILEPLQI